MIHLARIADYIHVEDVDEIALPVLAGGIKVSLVPILYGLIVFFVSLILRVIQKPKR